MKYNAKAMDIDPDHAEQAARLIELAFRWSSSPEGPVYWSEVFGKLQEISDAARDQGESQP